MLRPALQSKQSSLCGLHRSGDRGGRGPNGQIVSVKRAADEEGREAGRLLMERKVQSQERILAEHLDGFERSGFCDFEKTTQVRQSERKD